MSDDLIDREGFTDIGHDHAVMLSSWRPDRELNPQYADLPDVDVATVVVYHTRPDNGEHCASAARIWRGPREGPEVPTWDLVSVEPLHLEPSLLCLRCGDHGFIRDGQWVPA